MADFEPKQFGRFYLLEKLAVGGMAEIYKAKTFGAEGFEKMLAIKRILPHCSADKDFITMLIDEAKLSVLLSHANIVQVYDLGKVGDDYFISMEYINGVNLRDILYRCRERLTRMPTDIAVYLISEVAKGLDYAHRKTDSGAQPLNIVHRDISPQNVLISFEGEVKIVDFGIAKAAMNISHTMAGILKGKIAYMSPEQALGKAIDYRTDIFSVGILCYECLTGEKLFTGESQFEVLKKIRTTKIDVTRLPAGIPKPLQTILTKALAYFPKDRYQGAGDLQIDLTKFLYSTYGDFSPQKLGAFVKEVFQDELDRQRQQVLLQLQLEAKTSSINMAAEAIQEDIVVRNATGATRKAPREGTRAARRPVAPLTGTMPAIAERSTTVRGRREIGFRIAASIGVVAALALGVAGYVRFLHPRLFPAREAVRSGTTTPVASIPVAPVATPPVPTVPTTPPVENTKIETPPLPMTQPPALPEKLGGIRVVSNPSGAAIALNGRSTGKVTPATLGNLALNQRYTVSVNKRDFEGWSRSITLKEPTVATLAGDLKPKVAALPPAPKPTPADTTTPSPPEPEPKTIEKTPAVAEDAAPPGGGTGAIRVSSSPNGAEVFVNGEARGATPTTIAGLTGTVKVLVTKEGLAPYSTRVTIKPGQTVTLSASLGDLYGEVTVSSSPAGAMVYFDGQATAKTTVTIRKVRRDKGHSVRVVLDGHKTWERSFTFGHDGSKSFHADLQEE